jgi:SAM-dependent methyltransferase
LPLAFFDAAVVDPRPAVLVAAALPALAVVLLVLSVALAATPGVSAGGVEPFFFELAISLPYDVLCCARKAILGPRLPPDLKMRAVNAEAIWNGHARSEPYFAVLTDARFLRANLDARAEADFFATGDAYVLHLLDYVRRHISPVFEPKSILEFGCGPGRVAIPLAHRIPAAEIVAVDVAPVMRTLAAENARRLNAPNLLVGDTETVLGSRRHFDLINASIVFHHVPAAEGLLLLARVLPRIADRGVGVFSFVYQRTSTGAAAFTRWARRLVPGANRVANLIRRNPPTLPFLQPYLYDLSDVFATMAELGCTEWHIESERQGDVDVATIFTRRIFEDAAVGDAIAIEDAASHEVPRPRDFIDVRELIATASTEELNRTAEQYFAGLTNWEHHLAKPFASASDTPTLLINFAVLLEGLRLYPGLTVLEFGAGTGWLSRMLTQLGCRAILTDVSPTALRMAAELYERLPPIGERPAPTFLVFDGYRIDLPDESVDRVVTFDAFHHVTNPDAILGEFARVLRPGGIAAFAEPGPHHSKTAQSQFEMRTYGVVENDVDIHAIWSAAQQHGFSEIKLAGFNARPFHITLDAYEDLLASGETYLQWASWSRDFMKNVRNFYLFKAGNAPLDSRQADSVGAMISITMDDRAHAGAPIAVRATLENTGRGVWLPATDPLGGVSLGCHLFDADGHLLAFDHHWQWLPSAVAVGESIGLSFEMPPLAAGTYLLEFDLVAAGVTWFAQKSGSNAPKIRLRVDP